MTACRSCHQPITWTVTLQGNLMPVDATPTPDGNVTLTGRQVPTQRGYAPECSVGTASLFDDGTDRYMPHHATCPQADEWRRT